MALSAEVDRLFADCRTELPGAIPSEISAKYFSVLKDFCEWTNVWQENVDVPLVAGDTTYALTVAEGRIIRLMNLYDSQDPNKRWVDRASMEVPGALVIATTPSTTGPIWVATVAKTVKDPVDGDGVPVIDAWIVEKYYDVLKSGILSRMMMSSNKTYTNPQAGVLHGRLYSAGRANARSEVTKQNVHGQTNWRFPQTFGLGSQRGV